MHIVHLAGTFCCGKTTLINKFKEKNPLVASWDIKEDFHIPRSILEGGKFNIDLYMKQVGDIEDELFMFFKDNHETICIVESSGFNTYVNMALFKLTPAMKEIFLDVPNDLEDRANSRGDDIVEVNRFADKYMKFVEKNNVVLYTELQAKRALTLIGQG